MNEGVLPNLSISIQYRKKKKSFSAFYNFYSIFLYDKTNNYKLKIIKTFYSFYNIDLRSYNNLFVSRLSVNLDNLYFGSNLKYC